MNNFGQHPAAEKISVIVPVRNEEGSIRQLLNGLRTQTRQPDEIVITDGGSTDRTREMIHAYRPQSPVPVILVEADHALPGRGRNLAIERASHEWIASIDAGIVPDPHWLEELARTAREEPEAGVVYGRYEPVVDSYFTECAAMAYVPRSDRPRFVASSLFRRAAWEAAGRFPEDLRSGEDLLFFEGLDRARVPAAYSRGAVVHWSIQPDLRRTFRRFATYSRYSMIAGLGSQWQVRVSLLYVALVAFAAAGLLTWRPLLLVPPLALLARAARRIHNWRRGRGWRTVIEVLNPRRLLTVAWIALAVDAAMFRGVLDWLVRDRARVRERGAGHVGTKSALQD